MFRELHIGSKIRKKSKKMASLSSKTVAEGEELPLDRNRHLKDSSTAVRDLGALYEDVRRG